LEKKEKGGVKKTTDSEGRGKRRSRTVTDDKTTLPVKKKDSALVRVQKRNLSSRGTTKEIERGGNL